MVNKQSRDRDKTGTMLPILIPGTEREHDGRANFLEGKQQIQFVRRFTQADYRKEMSSVTPANFALKAMIARRAVAESGDDPDALKPFVHQEVRRSQRADVVLQKWMPVAMLSEMPARSAASWGLPLVTGKHASRNAGADKAAFLDLRTALQAMFAGSTSVNPQREARYGLAPSWTKAMSSARIVLWWAESLDDQPYRRFTPAIYCADPKAALYVWEALSEQRVRICVGCGEFFVPERTNQLYHANGRCGDRHRKRRQRSKSKSKRKKTGGS
jgi:predicted RNA-binding Zn ribbon-like protein